MTDRDLLELIANQVSKLTTEVDNLTEGMAEVKTDLAVLKKDIWFTRDVVIRIENDHSQKLGALMNGYKQNAERLDRHEEILSKKY